MPESSTSQCEGNEDNNFVPPLDQEACDFWLAFAEGTHFDIYVLKLKYMEGSGNWTKSLFQYLNVTGNIFWLN